MSKPARVVPMSRESELPASRCSCSHLTRPPSQHMWLAPTCMLRRPCSIWMRSLPLLLNWPTPAAALEPVIRFVLLLGAIALSPAMLPAARSAVASVQGWVSFRACSSAPSRVTPPQLPSMHAQSALVSCKQGITGTSQQSNPH
jgi:hypothetical protein